MSDLVRRALRRHWPAWPRKKKETNLRGETAPECSESDRCPSGRSKAPYGLLSSSFHMIAMVVFVQSGGLKKVRVCWTGRRSLLLPQLSFP